MKILIVEDEPLIAMHLELLVSDFGHEVCGIAASASEAIVAGAALLPDAVLMDIRLSDGTSGIDAAREIHAAFGLRCIFLSGNLDAQTRRDLQPYDPIAFVAKPILPSALRDALVAAETSAKPEQAGSKIHRRPA